MTIRELSVEEVSDVDGGMTARAALLACGFIVAGGIALATAPLAMTAMATYGLTLSGTVSLGAAGVICAF